MRPEEVRFAADGMLQSLATWLRLLGYDCAGEPNCYGRGLLEQAAAEDRVFLTRNTHLNDLMPQELLRYTEIGFVLATRLPQQLCEVVRRYSLDIERFVFSRCLLCNVPLRPLPTPLALARVPARILRDHHQFWACPHCHRIFWHGSHVANSLVRLHRWLESVAAG